MFHPVSNITLSFITFLVLVDVVLIVRFSSLVAGYISGGRMQRRLVVSLWLSGWFKLTERIQRGEVPFIGRAFVGFSILWVSFLLVNVVNNNAHVTWQVLVNVVAGVTALAGRCRLERLRSHSAMGYLLVGINVFAGAAAVTLSYR
mgnify:CR=1 FL=1